MANYNDILQAVLGLDRTQQEKLLVILNQILNPSTADQLNKELKETRFSKGLKCPYCSGEIVRFGRNKGRQRYRCKRCGKTFTDFVYTPIHGSHYPSKWLPFIDCTLQGLSLRKAAEIVGVTHVTLFYWRHKFLKALQQVTAEQFQGILEMDETYFLHSEKGSRNIVGRKPRKRGGVSQFRGISNEQVCVLVARDRNKTSFARTVCMGRPQTIDIKKAVDDSISGVSVLCTDAHPSYTRFAAEKNMQYYSLNSRKQRVKGLYHIQNVNAFHGRLKKWIKVFNGVASKYLDNYLAWFLFLDAKGCQTNVITRHEMLVKSCQSKTKETCRSIRESYLKLA